MWRCRHSSFSLPLLHIYNFVSAILSALKHVVVLRSDMSWYSVAPLQASAASFGQTDKQQRQSGSTFPLWLVWSVCFEDEIISNAPPHPLFFVTNNFSLAVAVISLSPPQTAALLASHPGGDIHRRRCHFEYPRVAASRSKANSHESKASTRFADRKHNKQNPGRATLKGSGGSRKKNCRARTLTNNGDCSRQTSRVSRASCLPALQDA